MTGLVTKTLATVRTEMSLHVLAYRLKRVTRIWASTRTIHTLRTSAVSLMSRQPGAARFPSEMGRYLPVNILDSGRSGRLVRVCAKFPGIGLANRFELVYLDKPGQTIQGWDETPWHGCPRMGHFRGLMRSVGQEHKVGSN
jgi:hypothetical protein